MLICPYGLLSSIFNGLPMGTSSNSSRRYLSFSRSVMRSISSMSKRSGCSLRMALQKLWKVAILTLSASLPIKDISRCRMALTPDSVNVRQRMFCGWASPCCRIYPILADRTCVLPVPGPARTRTGPSVVSTAFF